MVIEFLSASSGHVLIAFLPIVGRAADYTDVLMLGPPAQDVSNTLCIGNQARWIARTTWTFSDIELNVTHALHCV